VIEIVLRDCRFVYRVHETLTVPACPIPLLRRSSHESRARNVSKSDVVRERLRQPRRHCSKPARMRELVGDLTFRFEALRPDRARSATRNRQRTVKVFMKTL